MWAEPAIPPSPSYLDTTEYSGCITADTHDHSGHTTADWERTPGGTLWAEPAIPPSPSRLDTPDHSSNTSLWDEPMVFPSFLQPQSEEDHAPSPVMIAGPLMHHPITIESTLLNVSLWAAPAPPPSESEIYPCPHDLTSHSPTTTPPQLHPTILGHHHTQRPLRATSPYSPGLNMSPVPNMTNPLNDTMCM